MRKYTTIRKIYAWVGFITIIVVVGSILTFSCLKWEKQEKIINRVALVFSK